MSTHGMAVMVDDVDAHYARAVAAGEQVTGPPKDMLYGVREYDARDLEGDSGRSCRCSRRPGLPGTAAHSSTEAPTRK